MIQSDEPLQDKKNLKFKVYSSKMNLLCLKTFQSNINVVLLEVFEQS